MAWAMAGARMLVPLLAEGVREWRSSLANRWARMYDQGIRRRQRTCRMVAWISRHPRSARWALRVVGSAPRVAGAVARRTGDPYPALLNDGQGP